MKSVREIRPQNPIAGDEEIKLLRRQIALDMRDCILSVVCTLINAVKWHYFCFLRYRSYFSDHFWSANHGYQTTTNTQNTRPQWESQHHFADFARGNDPAAE
jgi:hypothetical protein